MRSNLACSVGFCVRYREWALFASSKILFASSMRSTAGTSSLASDARIWRSSSLHSTFHHPPLPELFWDLPVQFVLVSLIHATTNHRQALLQCIPLRLGLVP